MALSSMRSTVTGEAECMGTLASASGSVLCVGYSGSSQASPVNCFLWLSLELSGKGGKQLVFSGLLKGKLHLAAASLLH